MFQQIDTHPGLRVKKIPLVLIGGRSKGPRSRVTAGSRFATLRQEMECIIFHLMTPSQVKLDRTFFLVFENTPKLITPFAPLCLLDCMCIIRSNLVSLLFLVLFFFFPHTITKNQRNAVKGSAYKCTSVCTAL